MAIARVNHSKLDAEFFLKHHNVAWSFVPNMSLNNIEDFTSTSSSMSFISMTL